MGQWVRWEPELLLAQEVPPLVPSMEAPIVEESGATLVQEDGAKAEDDTTVQ